MTGIGDLLEVCNSILSLVYVITHAVDTYSWPKGDMVNYKTNSSIVIIEIILDVFFLINFLINFYISENRLFFTFQYTSFLEYASIFPTLFVRIDLISANKYVLVTRALRFLLIIKLEPILSRRAKDVTRNTFKILFTVMSVMIETGSFLMVVEKNGYAFHDYLYFMVVTMGTVGFGDINAQERLGRMIVVVSIFILLTYIPN